MQNLIAKLRPHVTVRRVVVASLVFAAIVFVVRPVGVAWLSTYHRTPLDEAILESDRLHDDVSDIVEPFVRPAARFDKVTERLWDLGFSTGRMLGSTIYRRRIPPGRYDPDERLGGRVNHYNEMLDRFDAVYAASFRRDIPAFLPPTYSVNVWVLVRENRTTAIYARTFTPKF